MSDAPLISRPWDSSPPPAGPAGTLAGDAATQPAGELELPAAILQQWQSIVETVAEVTQAPAALVMRVRRERIEVFRASRTSGNPYDVGESEVVACSGLYCEEVIGSGARLLVPNALADARWRENPDVPRGMVSYLGLPIRWPDGAPFGTLCVLDSKPNSYGPTAERLMGALRDMMEHHLLLIVRDAEARAVCERQAAELEDLEARFRHDPHAPQPAPFTAVDQLAGAVIHEINQPLAAIGVSTASCQRWLDQETPDIGAARAAVARLATASRRAAEVMDGLRALAQRTVVRTGFDLPGLVEDTLHMCADEIGRARVRVDLAFAADGREVLGDPRQLKLVFANLFRNAVDAMREVEGRERVLSVAATPGRGGRLQVTVDDTGAGLPPAHGERVFETAYTTKPTGMGLGLAICRSILEAHGGEIAAERRPGVAPGARFAFSLPTRAAASSPLAEAAYA